MELFLPRSEVYKNADFYFNANGYEVKRSKKGGCDYLTFSPSTAHVGVCVPKNVLSSLNVHMKISCFLKDEKEERIASYDDRNEEYYFEFPYEKWKEKLQNFYINGNIYDYVIEDNLIIPNILFVTTANDIVECEIKIDDENKRIQSVTANAPILLPLKDGTDVSLIDEDNYWEERIDISEYCKVVKIEKKKKTVSDKSVQKNSANELSETEEAIPSSDTANNKVITGNVTFENCEGYYFINKAGGKLELQGSNKITTQNTLEIYKCTKKDKETSSHKAKPVCIIPFPKSEYDKFNEIDKKNRKAGFIIKWNEDGNAYNIVREVEGKKKNRRLMSGLIVLLLLVTVGIYFFHYMKEVEPTCIIVLKAGEGVSIEKVRFENFDVTPESKTDYRKDSIIIKLYAILEKNNDVVEKLKEASVKVWFKDEGNSIYSLKDLGIVEAIKNKLPNEGKEPLSSERNILTPGRDAFNVFKNKYKDTTIEADDSLMINEGIQLVRTYSRFVFNIDTLIWNKINRENLASLQEYIKSGFNAYKQDASEMVEKEKKKKEELDKINEKIDDFLNVLNALKADGCTLSTVDVIARKYNNLENNLKNAVNNKVNVSHMLKCYTQFFGAKTLDSLVGNKKGLIRLINQKSYFSPLQILIMMNCYGAALQEGASDRFKIMKENAGMSFGQAFQKAIALGYVDENCKLLINK